MTKQTFKTVKLFETSKMPEEIAQPVFECLREQTSESTADFYVDDDGEAELKPITDWFIANGAERNEHVIIHHGDWRPDCIFDRERGT